ncbi:hypothetical protein DUI87_15548 [Hirundo rustica rustica]|uniref:Uncharacterized protein n=1 Tax=Hirundo rustica rustica TaxID=333673 RepID=A0A3M0JZD9_HIRRU|nr:hypothetical protein DUI87_15548 [Hirundo rustica rustica]
MSNMKTRTTKKRKEIMKDDEGREDEVNKDKYDKNAKDQGDNKGDEDKESKEDKEDSDTRIRARLLLKSVEEKE